MTTPSSAKLTGIEPIYESATSSQNDLKLLPARTQARKGLPKDIMPIN
jgi:hypothetical protein